MTDTTFVTPKTQVAEITGLPVDRIGVVRMQLDSLLKEGILIDLTITGESLFLRMADWSEIGVHVDDIRASRLTRGSKYLIPEAQYKRLKTIATRMRQTLDEFSLDITGFRPWRYLYYKSYDRWTESWKRLLDTFQEVKQDILDNYDQYIDELIADFRSIAEASWTSIKAGGYDWVIFNGTAYGMLEEFSSAVVQKALSKMPTRVQIEDELTADYRVSMLYGQEQIAEIEANAAIIRAQGYSEAERIKAQQHAEYVHDAILQEQYRHERELNQIEEQERWAKINGMMQAEAEHVRKQYAETVSPIEEAFTQVRNEMAKICVDAADSIQQSGFVRGKTAERLRGLMDFYQLISIQDDKKLLEKLSQLRTAIGPVGDERSKETPARSTAEVVNALNSVINLTSTIKADLAEAPSRFAFLD